MQVETTASTSTAPEERRFFGFLLLLAPQEYLNKHSPTTSKDA